MPRSLAMLLMVVAAPGFAHAAAPPPARKVDFTRDVRPILQRACVSCHGAERQRGGLRLDDGTLALRGGNSGAVLKPGDTAHSSLLARVMSTEPDTKMPPGKRTPLSAAEVALLRAWIDQGAHWPKEAGPVVTAAKSSHWAFQPVKRPAPPPVARKGWVRTPLDAFVLARLEKEKLDPSPEADRVTLIRRLSFDLIGLPPTPEEVDAFAKDTRPDAYERVVDRLLASPAYGERWGRHWLDLARYADSDGYEKDSPRPYAWRYRHWVIGALNADLPYDAFTVAQLAGDLLPGATAEHKAATGFHRNTLTNREGGVDQEQFRVEAVVDRVNTTAKVWLGLTLGCAQCHDHKYDPLAQREYYQFFAFFNSDKEVNLPAPVPYEGPAVARRKAEHERKLKALQAAVDERQARLAAGQAGWEQGLTPAQRKAQPAGVQAALAVPAEKRTARQAKQVADAHAKADAELQKRVRALAQFRKAAVAPETLAPALALGPARKTHVLLRGDFLSPGVGVEAGTPAVLPPLKGKGPVTRLDLARWLVDAANPLTPRVTANWAWQKFFGRGLVATPEDFGTQGEKPSHPELLDWLAAELVEKKWSLKSFHRMIVTSAAYRQSSALRPGLRERDPYNVLVARQARVRLEAEGVRDAALAASGLLVRAVGGPSVRPPQPAGISELTYANSARWVESTGPDRYRRGLYTWFQRTSPYPTLMTFDAPDANLSCVRRERSNTPLQALTLLNDAAFVECARALGGRARAEEKKERERLVYAFRLCVARAPTATELARLEALLADLKGLAAEDPAGAAELAGVAKGKGATEAAAWVALARALLNLDEFVTRE